MSIVFASFKKAKNYSGEKYSVATFQPKGFNFSCLKFLYPIDEEGRRIYLENYVDPFVGYVQALRKAYQDRWDIIKKWLDKLEPDNDIVLCCWCPYSEHAKDQIKEFGVFCCHSGLIAKMIAKHRPDIKIILDDDRAKKLFGEWSPSPVHIRADQIVF